MEVGIHRDDVVPGQDNFWRVIIMVGGEMHERNDHWK